jgi:superfamily II DNA helicase RecQ
MIDDNMPRHGFLFADDKGPWSTEQITKTLTRETTTRLGFRMTVQEYRHIAIAIDRKFIRGSQADIYDDDDDDGEDDVHDLMAAHSTKLANARYARMGGLTRSLTSESISIFRKISDKWQCYYKLESRRIKKEPTKVETSIIRDENYTSGCITSALRKMYGQGAEFRNEYQQSAVMKTAMGTNQLFVILPTGQGKSLTFMLPSMTPDAKTTLVITPLVALAEDMLQRCRLVDIDAIIYGRGTPRMATIVIIVTESAITNMCMQFIMDVFLAKRLDRIVFDECHKLIQDLNFRPKLAEIRKICVAVQSIFLTATFPPTMLARYQELLVIKDPQFVRMANHKLRTRYNVKVLNYERFRTLASDEMGAALTRCEDTDKVLVFCRSRADCEGWAKRWDCGYYHSQTEQKSSVLENWTSGLLFATSSLGAGVDIMNIRFIIHVGKPYWMIDFDQEVGRGGRSGDIVESVILLSDKEWTEVGGQLVQGLSHDERAMNEFLTTGGCRRRGMSKYLNGEEYEDDCEGLRGELCDNCKSDLASTTLGKRRIMEDDYDSRRVKQRGTYEQRQEDLRQVTMSEERRVQHALNVCEYLQGCCCICWLVDDLTIYSHEGKKCEELVGELGMTYGELRVGYMKYEDYSCCFRCGLPQELCGAEKSQGCKRVDVIFPLAIMSWIRREELGLEEVFEELGDGRVFEDVKEYVRWIMKREMCFGYKGTIGFRIFERIVGDRLI